jgi:hypothetical protein
VRSRVGISGGGAEGEYHWSSAASSTIEGESVHNRRSQRLIGPFANPDEENSHPFFRVVCRDNR